MTDNPTPEPTVQVPVSLIERALKYDTMPPGSRAELRALLSQPTPSAEPPCARCGHDVDQHGKSVTAGGIGCALLSCPCGWFIPSPTTPPRIEDMAPGTTFTAHVLGSPTRRPWRLLEDGRVHIEDHMGGWNLPDAIDPSTIRDVTPPKDVS